MEKQSVNPYITVTNASCRRYCEYLDDAIEQGEIVIKIHNEHKTAHFSLTGFKKFFNSIQSIISQSDPKYEAVTTHMSIIYNPEKSLHKNHHVCNDTCLICDRIESDSAGWLRMGTGLWVHDDCLQHFCAELETVYPVIQENASEAAAYLV